MSVSWGTTVFFILYYFAWQKNPESDRLEEVVFLFVQIYEQDPTNIITVIKVAYHRPIKECTSRTFLKVCQHDIVELVNWEGQVLCYHLSGI